MKRIAIFQTGQHTATNGSQLDASADYIRAVVSSYKPALHESPAVIGHPKDNAPAYGWAKALSFDERTGVLYADFDQVDSTFAEWLDAGRYKKRSASFYPPNHPNNPTPGQPYLRHVGFLGAQPPAVKGLPDFADDADVPVYEFSDQSTPNPNDDNPDEETMSQKPKATPAPDNGTPASGQSTPDVQIQDFAERESALSQREQALADAEKALKAREEKISADAEAARKAGFAEFADGLIRKGQLVPAEKDAIVSVLMDVNTEQTFDFAEDGKVEKRGSAEVLKGLLSRLPATVDFSEHSSTDPNTAARPQHNATAADEQKQYQAIQDFAEANGMTFAEAAANFPE